MTGSGEHSSVPLHLGTSVIIEWTFCIGMFSLWGDFSIF